MSNIVINIKAAKIANETIQYNVDDLSKKFTKARIPAPKNNPIPIIPKGLILPLVKIAINDIIRKIPAVMPKAIPIIFQSTKIVNAENNNPTIRE